MVFLRLSNYLPYLFTKCALSLGSNCFCLFKSKKSLKNCLNCYFCNVSLIEVPSILIINSISKVKIVTFSDFLGRVLRVITLLVVVEEVLFRLIIILIEIGSVVVVDGLRRHYLRCVLNW